MMHPTKPKRKIIEFFNRIQLNRPKFCQFVAVSMRAGAIMANVDILMAPSKDTKRSSQGTVAAKATGKYNVHLKRQKIKN
jgi:hypothetical protein